MTTMPVADRVVNVPPYLFVKLAEKRQECEAAGQEIIDLSIGDPDKPTPELIIESMRKAVGNPKFHKYPIGTGYPAFRKAAARFYKKRFDVDLDPDKEILALIGSKEGVGHLPMAVINPGDVALIPDPGYPVYPTSVMFAGGEGVRMPLKEENAFLPDVDAIPEDVLERTKLMFINYPNNPTGVIAPRDFYERVIALAKKYEFVIAHDNAYADVYFGEEKPLSILAIPGAREVAIELYSLSKTFNMTGWRIACAVGCPTVVGALGKLKSNLDSGVFGAVQMAAVTALDNYETLQPMVVEPYRKRRKILQQALHDVGWEVLSSDTTFYCWTKHPRTHNSTDFSLHLIDECGIIASPGNGFGEAGEGYIRFSLTASTEEIHKAAEIIQNTFSS